ncbi:hypothetical protein KSC_093520 [Ktedonobacter sp. SOSP1-52]|uniref:hypothetical protein n=1 Tax=Ktedonobacter sp. SOSP1-52 TaxID=2778366 RepID=UPI0019169EE9|nr:hypothetical protein [Ktedonobacter sp. SOSP1-52]GHO70460.1 hypothetical protein KSC_093520 [Ktedonobacter sp. SOSP1-52]
MNFHEEDKFHEMRKRAGILSPFSFLGSDQVLRYRKIVEALTQREHYIEVLEAVLDVLGKNLRGNLEQFRDILPTVFEGAEIADFESRRYYVRVLKALLTSVEDRIPEETRFPDFETLSDDVYLLPLNTPEGRDQCALFDRISKQFDARDSHIRLLQRMVKEKVRKEF